MSDDIGKVTGDEPEKVGTGDEPEKVGTDDFEGHKLADPNRKVTDRADVDDEGDFEAHKLWTDKVNDG